MSILYREINGLAFANDTGIQKCDKVMLGAAQRAAAKTVNGAYDGMTSVIQAAVVQHDQRPRLGWRSPDIPDLSDLRDCVALASARRPARRNLRQYHPELGDSVGSRQSANRNPGRLATLVDMTASRPAEIVDLYCFRRKQACSRIEYFGRIKTVSNLLLRDDRPWRLFTPLLRQRHLNQARVAIKCSASASGCGS
jgi:hypothetical protein